VSIMGDERPAVFENQIAIERRELAEDLQGEHEELALIYRNKGNGGWG